MEAEKLLKTIIAVHVELNAEFIARVLFDMSAQRTSIKSNGKDLIRTKGSSNLRVTRHMCELSAFARY